MCISFPHPGEGKGSELLLGKAPCGPDQKSTAVERNLSINGKRIPIKSIYELLSLSGLKFR